MTEVAFISIPAGPIGLKFITRLDFALVVRVGTVVGEPAFSMDELLADSVGGEFVVVGCGLRLLHVGHVVGGVVVARVDRLVGIRVHDSLFVVGFYNILILNRAHHLYHCLLYTSPSPRDLSTSRMPSSA